MNATLQQHARAAKIKDKRVRQYFVSDDFFDEEQIRELLLNHLNDMQLEKIRTFRFCQSMRRSFMLRKR